ncbi:MAG TPA: penicillin-binding protein 2 [Patescibacteria group bacterium]|nr:penicillin-binding protein 2 [Patescibacteria group bacterium]
MAAIERRDESVLNLRCGVILAVLVVIFSVLGTRLFYLQVIRHQHYSNQALSNRMHRERIVAPRGLIRDRHGAKLVVNTPVYTISILPGKIEGKDSRLSLACRWLGIDEDTLREDVAEWIERFPDGREMTVVQAADKDQISVLMENRDLFNFFKLVMKHRRQYPGETLAAHILGYVGEVTDEDINRSGKLYPGDIIGRTGIEFQYERFLRGIDGMRVVQISAEGAQLGELEGTIVRDGKEEVVRSRPPIPGNDIELTIDLDLQRAVERIFDWERGSVIVMDPRSGEIRAAVSRPTYNPNMFHSGVSERTWKRLYEDPANPLFNRVMQATYPPGSVFKVITVYAGLVNGVISAGTRFDPCFGAYKFGIRYFGCWKPEGHGSLDLHGAIVRSCDVYFYQIGERLTADQFAEAGALFGLGAKTGLDLPSEATGIIPDHAFYDKRFGRGKWTKGHLLNYSIGQGEILTTPIQLCTMTAILANGGKLVHPHIVRRIVGPGGEIVRDNNPGASPIPGIDRRAMNLIRRAMEDVIADEHGTGRASRLLQVRIAGKTGTAQNPHGEDHALFVAYAPADDPTIVLTIVMENAGHGGAVAAPLAREILAICFPAVAGASGARGEDGMNAGNGRDGGSSSRAARAGDED